MDGQGLIDTLLMKAQNFGAQFSFDQDWALKIHAEDSSIVANTSSRHRDTVRFAFAASKNKIVASKKNEQFYFFEAPRRT